MEISPSVLTVIGTLGGVLIGAITSVITTYLGKKSEERRHFQALAVQVAQDSWRTTVELGKNGRVAPLTDYIIHAALMCQLLTEKKLTPDLAGKRAEEVSRILDRLGSNAENARRRNQPADIST